nr:DUF131 domain-containing protein [Candidatus Njordarchaeota archaeon]
MSNEGRLIAVGAILSVIGLLTIVTGLVANSLIAGNSGSASFGGVIMVGPIPLIFGTDRTALLIAVVGAVILMVAAFAIIYMGAGKRVAVHQET